MVSVVTVVLLVAVAVVAVIGVVGAVRRGLADERSSVREYQQTLDTLRHLSDRRTAPPRGEPAPAAPVPSEATAGHAPPSGAAGEAVAPWKPSSVRAAGAGSAEGATGLDAPHRETQGVPPGLTDRPGNGNGGPPPAPPPLSSYATTAADAVRQLAATRATIGRRSKRPVRPPGTRPRDRRPLIGTAAAIVVVGSLTGAVVALHPLVRSGSSTPGVHHRAAPAAHRRRSAGTKRPTNSPSSVRSPLASGLVPVTASTTAATYDVAASAFSVSLTATGPCWVEAVDTTTGQLLWEGTLEAGQIQTVPATAGLFLRLGNAPDVAVSEGGLAVQLPSGYDIVFNLTFVTT